MSYIIYVIKKPINNLNSNSIHVADNLRNCSYCWLFGYFFIEVFPVVPVHVPSQDNLKELPTHCTVQYLKQDSMRSILLGTILKV
jgi:hypothetical protein